MNKEIIVADTGPLIALALTNCITYLPKCFKTIYVPTSVLEEAIQNLNKPGAKGIKQALDNGILTPKQVLPDPTFETLAGLLDQGETEALTLAKQINCLALVDEKRGRQVAQHLNIPIIGSAAVLIQLKHKGFIPQVKPLLSTLNENGYRLSDKLVKLILQRSGE
ncbi:DUF3368 domain-containing protein [Zooshikella harenae]|uniref:DUF3368 domain-containing protein n=1 Tax=Zooshikella harenae TaxID=2827238 RepID=A0ABS5ZHJ5_9GAMM|nr:DUF3368 domain-containing protein [Zooshikella harenae]MBU2713539.1 DUF3368 domain-containing protein [Zooshikella harenae]